MSSRFVLAPRAQASAPGDTLGSRFRLASSPTVSSQEAPQVNQRAPQVPSIFNQILGKTLGVGSALQSFVPGAASPGLSGSLSFLDLLRRFTDPNASTASKALGSASDVVGGARAFANTNFGSNFLGSQFGSSAPAAATSILGGLGGALGIGTSALDLAEGRPAQGVSSLLQGGIPFAANTANRFFPGSMLGSLASPITTGTAAAESLAGAGLGAASTLPEFLTEASPELIEASGIGGLAGGLGEQGASALGEGVSGAGAVALPLALITKAAFMPRDQQGLATTLFGPNTQGSGMFQGPLAGATLGIPLGPVGVAVGAAAGLIHALTGGGKTLAQRQAEEKRDDQSAFVRLSGDMKFLNDKITSTFSEPEPSTADLRSLLSQSIASLILNDWGPAEAHQGSNLATGTAAARGMSGLLRSMDILGIRGSMPTIGDAITELGPQNAWAIGALTDASGSANSNYENRNTIPLDPIQSIAKHFGWPGVAATLASYVRNVPGITSGLSIPGHVERALIVGLPPNNKEAYFLQAANKLKTGDYTPVPISGLSPKEIDRQAREYASFITQEAPSWWNDPDHGALLERLIPGVHPGGGAEDFQPSSNYLPAYHYATKVLNNGQPFPDPTDWAGNFNLIQQGNGDWVPRGPDPAVDPSSLIGGA